MRTYVAVLALAFLSRCLFLDLALPYGDPLDEPYHYAYAAFLAETGRVPSSASPSVPLDALRPLESLPRSSACGSPFSPWGRFVRLDPRDRARRRDVAFRFSGADRRAFVAPNYESQQPPLFYMLAAGILRLLPHARVDIRLQFLRIFAACCALIGVPLAFCFFRAFLPERSAVAASAAMVALPGPSFLVGRFTNDALALALVPALLLLLLSAARGELDRRRSAALAGVLAAGCWTKLSFLPLVPAAPLISVFAPRGRRAVTLLRSLSASALSLMLFSPWLLHQHRDSGSWLGLTPTKRAVSIGVGTFDRIADLPGALRGKYWVVFGRTFLWPGTHSAMGAPPAVAVVLTAGLLAIWLAPLLSRKHASPFARQGGIVSRATLLLFMAAELLYTSSFAAIARARGFPSEQLGLGCYAVILTPAVMVAGCLSGRGVPRAAFLTLVALSIPAAFVIDLGVLPGVYSGRTLFNGANAPFSEYGRWVFSPATAFQTYHSVALLDVSPLVLAVLWLAGQAAVAAVLWLPILDRPVRA